jgi:hypothetical protein
MAKPEMLDLLTRDRRRLVAVRASAGQAGGPLPDPETLWRKPALTVANGRNAGQTLSLEDMIDRHRRMVLVDAGDGPRPVETVFTSLLFVVAEPVADPDAMARFLIERIRQSFGPLIDPLEPPAIAFETSLTATAALTVHLGYGVHAPFAGEAARGRILFQPAGEREGTPVTLPSGREAGIYPRQRWLAFARGEALAAATHPDLPGGVTFLISAPGEVTGGVGAHRDGPAVSTLADGKSGQDKAGAARTVEAQPSATPPPPGVDASFDIVSVTGQEGRSLLGALHVAHDRRPSRLWRTQPQGPCLAVVGVCVPARLEGQRIERFWLEVDAGGRLRASGLQAAAQSVVVRGARARLYSRRELRYVGGADAYAARTVDLGGEKRTLLMVEDGALGYVAAPPTPRPVTAVAGADTPDAWAFDWIDEALFVQLASGQVASIGDLLAVRPLGALGTSGASVTLAGLGDAWLLDGARGVAASGAALQPGQRVVLGPLVLEALA